MKYEKTCSGGSFKAWGSGFIYDYNATSNSLDIARQHDKRAFVHLQFDDQVSENPLAYVASLNKTNQIKALMYSNNATLDLTETMELKRMMGIIASTAKISRCAYDLETQNFERFSAAFVKDFNLKKFKIKNLKHNVRPDDFFIARMQTLNNNSICVRGCTMPGLIAALSDRTLRDLITMEFGARFDNSAQNLLNASSKLSTISRVLDENFIPEKRIEQYKEKHKHLDAAAREQQKTVKNHGLNSQN